MFNDNFFEDIRIVREEADCDEALRRLANYPELTRIVVFWGGSWNVLYARVIDRNPGKDIGSKEAWEELLMPAMFLAVREVSDGLWNEMWEHDMAVAPEHHEESELYLYLRNVLRVEIEQSLLDGVSLAQDVRREEEEWPMDLYDEETGELVPYDVAAPDNTEEEALNNVMAHQIMDELSEKEIEILTADHGDGPALAKKYGMSEEAIRTRRHWLLRRLRKKYSD